MFDVEGACVKHVFVCLVLVIWVMRTSEVVSDAKPWVRYIASVLVGAT